MKSTKDTLAEKITLSNVPKKHITNPRTIHKKKQPQSEILYAYISEHPGCSASEIKKNRSLSQSTVNRILADLKKEGRIEYVGSKKTGGYYLVNIPQESEVAGPVLQEEACSISS